MNYLLPLIIIVSAVAVFIVCFFRMGSGRNEGYGTPLGQLAPYKYQLNECINQCNRQDPSRRLLAAGNFNCGKYCEFVITEMARHGVPPSKVLFNDDLKTCEKICDSGSEREKKVCVSTCMGQKEVAQWCKELWCPYATINENSCMKQCFWTNTTNNNNLSWSWQEHG